MGIIVYIIIVWIFNWALKGGIYHSCSNPFKWIQPSPISRKSLPSSKQLVEVKHWDYTVRGKKKSWSIKKKWILTRRDEKDRVFCVQSVKTVQNLAKITSYKVQFFLLPDSGLKKSSSRPVSGHPANRNDKQLGDRYYERRKKQNNEQAPTLSPP